MKQPIQEYQKYIDLLTTVYSKDDSPVTVKAIRIHNANDTYSLRLHVENNGKLDPPLEFPVDDMRTKITKIKNFSVNSNLVYSF